MMSFCVQATLPRQTDLEERKLNGKVKQLKIKNYKFDEKGEMKLTGTQGLIFNKEGFITKRTYEDENCLFIANQEYDKSNKLIMETTQFTSKGGNPTYERYLFSYHQNPDNTETVNRKGSKEDNGYDWNNYFIYNDKGLLIELGKEAQQGEPRVIGKQFKYDEKGNVIAVFDGDQKQKIEAHRLKYNGDKISEMTTYFYLDNDETISKLNDQGNPEEVAYYKDDELEKTILFSYQYDQYKNPISIIQTDKQTKQKLTEDIIEYQYQ